MLMLTSNKGSSQTLRREYRDDYGDAACTNSCRIYVTSYATSQGLVDNSILRTVDLTRSLIINA